MKIYVILSYTGSVPSKLIKRVTHKEYTHVSIGTEKDLSNMYSFGRKYTYFPWYGGFIKENINDGLYRRMKSSKIAVYEIIVSQNEFNLIQCEIENFKENKNLYFYDYLGAAGVYFKRNLFRNNGYICSSFVNEVLNKTGINTNLNNWEIQPVQFSNIKNSRLIYEGLSINYKIINTV